MKILWLSITKGLYRSESDGTSYNGGGWIASLQKLFVGDKENELGFVFITHNPGEKEYKDENISYFPIYSPSLSGWAKIKQYYGGYRSNSNGMYLPEVQRIVKTFRPDAVHLFGLENPMALALGQLSTPKIAHLQGLLSPYSNAFMPPGLNTKSFVWPPTLREWVLRNGYIFAKKSMDVRGEREYELFKMFDNYMGRTEWDFRVSQLLSPKSKYFHVDEVLRDAFYSKAGQWNGGNKGSFTIISTLSNTIYKGLDLILKTAQLLKRITALNFTWQVIGIKITDGIVKFFEKELDIKGSDVGVEYLGVKSEEELCNLLLQSNVFVHPSYIDNSPNSVCEAQLLGMPVVGCDVGGVSSLIHDRETGYLVPANAPFELAYILRELSSDIQGANELGHRAFESASLRHDRTKIKNDLMDAYEHVVCE